MSDRRVELIAEYCNIRLEIEDVDASMEDAKGIVEIGRWWARRLELMERAVDVAAKLVGLDRAQGGQA